MTATDAVGEGPAAGQPGGESDAEHNGDQAAQRCRSDERGESVRPDPAPPGRHRGRRGENRHHQPEEDEDEPRFRGGISIGGGGLFYSGAAAGLGTVDGRIGVQIMDLLGVYVQSHLALGAGSGAFAGSAGGTLVVGSSESLAGIAIGMETIMPSVYRKGNA